MKWVAAVRRAFNLWLLLGIFFCAGAGLVVLNTVLMLDFVRDDLTNVCAAARSTYEEEGPEALRLFFRGVAVGWYLQVTMLDANERDVITGRHKPMTGVRHPLPFSPGAPPANIGTGNRRYSLRCRSAVTLATIAL